jgi:hypothetical protein
VCFKESGFASVVASGSRKPCIEVGIIGREGMTAVAVVLGNDRATHETYMQLGGKGLRIRLVCGDGTKPPQAAARFHAVCPCVPFADHVDRSGQWAKQD